MASDSPGQGRAPTNLRRSNLRAPGMPCPQCGQRIVIEAAALLSGQPIQCASCGLELRVNTEQSKETLDALRSYMGRYEKQEQKAIDHVAEATPDPQQDRKPGRRSRSRKRRARVTRERTTRSSKAEGES
ncbi:MAG: CSL-type zinc finger protein [bacterium]|nr:CSL-type zinc finger protein [bacterium]